MKSKTRYRERNWMWAYCSLPKAVSVGPIPGLDHSYEKGEWVKTPPEGE